MKPIIIDMKDMSDSTEVYESRPNPILTGFIYLILAMVSVAMIWMYFFKIDIVVKGTGTVATAKEVSTVTNQIPGTIIERTVQDGQAIKEGEVLYTVSTDSQLLQLSALENQMKDNEERANMLNAYQSWLEKEEEIPSALMDNLYYNEVIARKNLVELGKESSLQTYSEEMSTYGVRLDANAGMITYYEEAINKSKQMITDIKDKKNSFAATDTYYWNTVQNFLVQYQNMILQYDDTLNQFQKELTAAEDNIKELEQSKMELEQQQEPTPAMTVSGSDISNLGNTMSSTLTQQIQELDTLLIAQNKAKETAEQNISDLSGQKNSALNAYEAESIAAIENSIFNYQQSLLSYEGANLEYKNGQNMLVHQGTELEISNLVVQEMYSVAEELESCRQTQLQLSQQIETLKQNLEDAQVKATVDGCVNFVNELVEGDYVTSGQQVLSIIPDSENGAFIVKSYVENKDIAKVYEGMEVTYEIAAYPSREYGTLKGIVTFVSADLKVNNNGSAYYVVETSVDAEELRNHMGEKAELKVGMLCETKIVVEEKRVLEVLAEKLFHLTK